MSTPHLELGSLTLAKLQEMVLELGQPRYRASQIRAHAWAGGVGGFQEMASLPVALRHDLATKLSFRSLEVVAETTADRGLTTKLLLRGHDAEEVEAVLIRHPGGPGVRPRNTVCVSSQIGCAIGCLFCATGQLGLRRNLTASEIVDQVRAAAGIWREAGSGLPTNVVFMGMGEPLHNYGPVVGAIRLLQDWGVSPRHVVVSTSGLVPEIDQLATEKLPVRLAISLHAADDSLRNRLVPLNRRYPLSELKAAALRFSAATGRRVSLEYVLIANVNDRPEDAVALRRLATSVRAHVNLIPMNPIPNSELAAPPQPACRRFAELVGSRASIRFSRGERATAACGQLRASMAALPRRTALAAAAHTDLVGGEVVLGRASG
ncbi:MAG TPA: 23S rRNA (adenine(2503)-C(2))-methyltransferase RlmN [Candidatus Dormibacteraeota bacterium]|nr:23S rRNA (adenine(2503)-C(2))-methyltransferase RlmN [Candidatus Dormibacteraeota bacterium]